MRSHRTVIESLKRTQGAVQKLASMVRSFAIAAVVAAGGVPLTADRPAAAQTVLIAAAENVYGDIARQIGGAAVLVTSILSSPDQDPHLFEADPSTARILRGARIAIANGIGYDAWMDKLLKADPAPVRIEIVVADVAGKTSGDNPHLWYDPGLMSAFAKRLSETLSSVDTAHESHYRQAAASFDASLKPLTEKIAAMKARYAGVSVTASEPLFGYMAEQLGLDVRNQRFQRAVMNDTEPSPSDVAAFEDDLKGHKVKAMLYNSQADDQAVRRLVEIARAAHVPVVGITETEPGGTTYQAWMLAQLDALDHALAGDGS